MAVNGYGPVTRENAIDWTLANPGERLGARAKRAHVVGLSPVQASRWARLLMWGLRSSTVEPMMCTARPTRGGKCTRRALRTVGSRVSRVMGEVRGLR